MLEELHELLGFLAATSLGVVVGAGVAAYRYQWVKAFVPLQRATLVRIHFWVAVVFQSAMVLHYALAPHVHGAQQAGALALAVCLLVGFSFRVSRKHFHPAIRAKAVLVILGGVLLVAGHWLVEDHDHDHEELESSRGNTPVVATVWTGSLHRSLPPGAD